MLSARNIFKYFGTKCAIEDVSLEVSGGSIVAVVGPSGGGKTSLLRALALVDPPSSGEVVVDSERFVFPVSPSRRIHPPWPRVTMVFQQLFLWPHLSIRENIYLPLYGDSSDERSILAGELIDSFALRDFLDQLPFESSIGQRQRAAIVRALALKPAYLLLDEVTSALDVEHVKRLGDVLVSAKEDGTAIILVTHLLGFARSVADRYLFMECGRSIEAGNIADLDASQTNRVRDFIALA